MNEINLDLLKNFIDRNIGFRKFEELPKHKEGTLYHNKYTTELEIFESIKRIILRDELQREPTEDELTVNEMPKSLSKYF